MLNIVLFGPPGAGKGTQSELIVKELKVEHLSTGDLLRCHKKIHTPLGLEAQKYMDAGNLVPDTLVIQMLEEAVSHSDNAVGFLFDGYPRTVKQAEKLSEFLASRNDDITLMLALQVPQEELEKRLLNRGKTSGRPDDQDLGKIRKRIEVYQEETLPVARYYQDKGKFEEIVGVGPVEEIFQSILDVIARHTP